MLVLVVVIWEVLAVIGDVAEFILPRPTVILVSLGEISGSLPRHIQATAEAAGLGYVLGAVVGAGLALLMSVLPAIRTAVYPLVLATQTTPKIAVAPLFIIWFGIGLLPKVLIVALLVFFPILINTAAGLEAVDRSQLDLMRSVHASRLQVYRHVRFPTAVPFIFAGLRLALTVSIIGAIVSEWVAAERGLGYLLLLYNSQLRTAHLFAVLLVLMAAASLSFAVLAALEHRLSWEARVSRGSTLATTAAEAGV
jgi:NitT/TauT family transport system permease protein